MEEQEPPSLEDVALLYAADNETDIVLYNGRIDNDGFGSLVCECCASGEFAKNVILILVTYGGAADAAYKMARFLQEHYERVTVFVPTECKSAGTILAIGAHEIVVSEFGQLGPLDVQVLKQDELFERGSGASVVAAMDLLKEKSFDLFEEFLIKIKGRSGGAVTLRTCTDIAATVTAGVFSGIYSQIDPNYLGEMSRNLKIAEEYANRLAEISENIDSDAIHHLVYDYPEHGFVIDCREAESLFRNVSKPGQELYYIMTKLAERVLRPAEHQDISILAAFATTKQNKETVGVADNEDQLHSEDGSEQQTDTTGAGGSKTADLAEHGECPGSGEAAGPKEDSIVIQHPTAPKESTQ